MNGSLDWLEGDSSIVGFDLGAHRHRELQFPDGVEKQKCPVCDWL